jgi:hypothetical protein
LQSQQGKLPTIHLLSTFRAVVAQLASIEPTDKRAKFEDPCNG